MSSSGTTPKGSSKVTSTKADRQVKAAGRAKVKQSLEEATNHGVDDRQAVVEGRTWKQEVLDARHEQLAASASDHYQATIDRFTHALSTWSDRSATVWLFGESESTPAKFRWSKLIDLSPFTDDGGGQPLYSYSDLLGFESAEVANQWREQASDLFLTVADACWAYLKGESDEARGVKVSPIDDLGQFGDVCLVAVLFSFGGYRCQAFAHMDEAYPQRFCIDRIDIGDVVGSEGELVWDSEQDLLEIEVYKRIRQQADKAYWLQRQTVRDNETALRDSRVIERKIKNKGLIK